MKNVQLLLYAGPPATCILCDATARWWFRYEDQFIDAEVRRPTCHQHGTAYRDAWQARYELEMTRSTRSTKQKRTDDRETGQMVLKPVFGQHEQVLKPTRKKKVA